MQKTEKQKPTRPCHVCGLTDWWWRPSSQWGPGEWLCGHCHPDPNKEAEVSTEKGHCKHGEFILTEGCPQCIAERRADKGALVSNTPAPVPSEEAEVSNNLSNEMTTELPANMTAHQPYRLADGSIVPSVTTILGILDKPRLPYWAWDLGRQGLDYREVRDAAAGRKGIP